MRCRLRLPVVAAAGGRIAKGADPPCSLATVQICLLFLRKLCVEVIGRDEPLLSLAIICYAGHGLEHRIFLQLGLDMLFLIELFGQVGDRLEGGRCFSVQCSVGLHRQGRYLLMSSYWALQPILRSCCCAMQPLIHILMPLNLASGIEGKETTTESITTILRGACLIFY